MVSDWSTSKCRTFSDLDRGRPYRVSVVARNLDGIITEPADRRDASVGGEEVNSSILVYTWGFSGTQDPWVKGQIRDAAMVYGLTDVAKGWMNEDIFIERMRGQPGYAGYTVGRVRIGHSGLVALMHETMHAFWRYWDGFPETCDQMNMHTFRRDIAQFALEFRNFERSSVDNPLAAWRPYYNLIGGLLALQQLEGEDYWDVLERGEYGRFDTIWHRLETSIPMHTRYDMSLIPPRLRKYFYGFVEDGESKTWEEVLDWYSRLPDEDLTLWFPFQTHDILYYSPRAEGKSQDDSRTRIPEPLRTTLWGVNRQMLVDFINTLEDMAPRRWWDVSPDFWRIYVRLHLHRIPLFESELDSSVGIEIEQSNLDAVIEALRSLNAFHCEPGVFRCRHGPDYRGGQTVEQVREIIASIEQLSDAQRAVLLAMVDVETSR